MKDNNLKTYHRDLSVEEALLEMTRIGMKGNPSAVRKFATQLIRSTPETVSDASLFRSSLHKAMNRSERRDEFSFSSESLPMEASTGSLLVDIDELPSVNGLVLAEDVQSSLDEVIKERKNQDLLASRGLVPTQSLMLSGPPGVGKTLASQWMAQELDVPLVSLNLATVLSSYLGTSGRNVRSVLDFAKATPCVLLLDEFDALGKARDDESDVGELKRIVNVLLVELDRWSDRSLLIAATNHPQLLDPAIERRFDRIVEIGLPQVVERRRLLEFNGGGQISENALDALAEILEGYSPSDLTRLVNRMARKSVLHDLSLENLLLQEVLTRKNSKNPNRVFIWKLLHEEFDISFRKLAELSGVSHPTVANALRGLNSEKR